MLVCTTIVENGLDISNANTLVIERGDLLGLSQLHQLRGRVGRARERAYAYFLYPPEKPLTEKAHDRLATIAQHTELGAGMQVAMKDLEIRGAGNLLGGEQSGHIAAVGFDLYMRLVGEAVAEFNDAASEVPTVKVELPVDAHLPHDYIPGERLRLEAYRRIAAPRREAGVAAVRAELRDRYGELPPEVENLLAVAAFRVFARRFGVTEVAQQGKYIRFAPLHAAGVAGAAAQAALSRDAGQGGVSTVLVPRPTTARIGGQPVRDTALLDWCTAFLDGVLSDVRPTGNLGSRVTSRTEHCVISKPRTALGGGLLAAVCWSPAATPASVLPPLWAAAASPRTPWTPPTVTQAHERRDPRRLAAEPGPHRAGSAAAVPRACAPRARHRPAGRHRRPVRPARCQRGR